VSELSDNEIIRFAVSREYFEGDSLTQLEVYLNCMFSGPCIV